MAARLSNLWRAGMDGLDVIAALDAALPATIIPREGDPVVISTELVLATLAVLEAIDD